MRDCKHFDLKLDYNFLLLKYVPNLERSPLPAAEGWLLADDNWWFVRHVLPHIKMLKMLF
jgi:hypothetical protein